MNGEWDLVGMPIRQNNIFYHDYQLTYMDVTFYLVIRRKVLYYLYNLILPCICMLALSSAAFMLPPESGEKISLSITSLLSMTFFLTFVAESTPAQSLVIPLLSEYNNIEMYFLNLNVFLKLIALLSFEVMDNSW